MQLAPKNGQNTDKEERTKGERRKHKASGRKRRGSLPAPQPEAPRQEWCHAEGRTLLVPVNSTQGWRAGASTLTACVADSCTADRVSCPLPTLHAFPSNVLRRLRRGHPATLP